MPQLLYPRERERERARIHESHPHRDSISGQYHSYYVYYLWASETVWTFRSTEIIFTLTRNFFFCFLSYFTFSVFVLFPYFILRLHCPGLLLCLYCTTHNISIHAPAGFESVIPASERPQAYAFDRTATGICGIQTPGRTALV